METKYCPRCKTIKPLDEFHKHRAGRKAGKPLAYCKKCKSEIARAYFEEDPARFNAIVKKSKDKDRAKVRAQNSVYHYTHREQRAAAARRRLEKSRRELLNFFGHECEICGENLVEFLTIDHIAGNGAGMSDKKKGIPGGWYGFWNTCNKAGWNETLYETYRVLCFNCNCARDRRPNPYQDIRASLGASKALECTY